MYWEGGRDTYIIVHSHTCFVQYTCACNKPIVHRSILHYLCMDVYMPQTRESKYDHN